MSLPLDYASPTTPRMLGRRLAAIPAAVALVSAIVIFVWSTHLAAAAELALIVPTDCGTGRHLAQYQLYYFVPWLLMIPIGCWIGAHFTQAGTVLARCSVWTSILAWGLSTLFVVYC